MSIDLQHDLQHMNGAPAPWLKILITVVAVLVFVFQFHALQDRTIGSLTLEEGVLLACPLILLHFFSSRWAQMKA